MKGNVTVILKNREGEVVKEQRTSNLIVSSGKRYIADLFRGEETHAMSHMAVGTGKSHPRATDLALDNELSPRQKFDKSFLSEEESAYLVLKDSAKKDVLKVTSRLPGERGNHTSVGVKKSTEKKFTLLVFGEKNDEFIEEEFKGVNLNGRSKRYVEKVVNEESELITVKRIVKSVLVNTPKTTLENGRDTTLTLGATFGYEDCNAPISEGGIFNAPREGTMYNRVVFPEINKTDKLTLSLIWKISF